MISSIASLRACNALDIRDLSLHQRTKRLTRCLREVGRSILSSGVDPSLYACGPVLGVSVAGGCF